jgi:hypothetical protein
MSLFFAAGSPTTEISSAEMRAGLNEALTKLGAKKKVLAVPPDFVDRDGVGFLWRYPGRCAACPGHA